MNHLRDISGVEPKIGVFPPKWMVKIMENPIKMDDLGLPLFSETSICHLFFPRYSKQIPCERSSGQNPKSFLQIKSAAFSAHCKL